MTTRVSPLTAAVWESWRPPDLVRAIDWIPRHIVIPTETETPGPFDLDLYPHSADVLRAWDDPDVRTILLPWGSRLGKTTTALALLAFAAVTNPRPAMVAREDKERTDDLILTQLYPILDASPATASEVPPPHRRDPRRGVRFRRCRIRRAYSGSPATMAGFPACYGLGSEISKWQRSRGGEADPLYLFRRRALTFPFDSKYILESTPAELGRCNITELCDAEGVDVRRRIVPCPICGEYQELVFGRGAPDEPGLIWDRRSDGRHDVALAEMSAYYRCIRGCRIESKHRAEMLRRGVWLSANQKIDAAGRISGERPVAATVAFGHPESHPVGALHSLVISGWGQIAREWIEVLSSREGRREFYNQVLGRVWDPQPDRVQPSELLEHMGIDAPLRVCPKQTAFLTRGVDVGRVGDELIFYWWVAAWWRGGGGQLVDLGIAFGETEMARLIHEQSYPVLGSGRSLRPVRTGIDSGSFTQQIYEFCRRLPGTWPLKGSSRDSLHPHARNDFLEMYRPAMQTAGLAPQVIAAKRRARAYDLILPNTDRSQQWLEDRMTGLVRRDAPDWFGIPNEALIGEVLPGIDLTHHLLGDVQDERGAWKKRWEDQEFRDACRYALVMAWEFTRNGRLWDSPPGTPAPDPAPPIRAADSADDRPSRRWRLRRRHREDE